MNPNTNQPTDQKNKQMDPNAKAQPGGNRPGYGTTNGGGQGGDPSGSQPRQAGTGGAGTQSNKGGGYPTTPDRAANARPDSAAKGDQADNEEDQEETLDNRDVETAGQNPKAKGQSTQGNKAW